MSLVHLISTKNFEHNLDGIELFLTELSDAPSFQHLLDKLFNEVLPNLARIIHKYCRALACSFARNEFLVARP